MFPEKFLAWGRSKSCIRELAAYGNARKAQIGEDKVFDFSLGNPSVPAPDCVNKCIKELLDTEGGTIHGYTPAVGLPGLRKVIAEDLNKKSTVHISPDYIYVCCGAAAGLVVALRALLMPGDEVIAFAPFFPEYRVFTEGAGGKLVCVKPDEALQPDIEDFEKAISEKTKAVIVNTPNNPSGVVLRADTLGKIGEILKKAEEKYGHSIYLISDEPYRELVYDGEPVPCVFDYYHNTVMCYSFSKSLSLPGERIGYLALSSAIEQAERDDLFATICGAARAAGYVNAPSLMQRVIEKCIGSTSDLSVYKENRELLYNGLKELGFKCVYPDGAFYLFMKCPEEDAKAFSEKAKKHELLLVPSDDFGMGGYVRIAYCVPADMIRRSMPAFKALAEEYGL